MLKPAKTHMRSNHVRTGLA